MTSWRGAHYVFEHCLGRDHLDSGLVEDLYRTIVHFGFCTTEFGLEKLFLLGVRYVPGGCISTVLKSYSEILTTCCLPELKTKAK